ncbi:hypothetical protein H0A71_16735 [Alcaligenaceae bacterium]|nr:hypothetical protein [Alcaligenaceae bacterium]
MSLTFFNRSNRESRHVGSLLTRAAVVVGLALTLSACAYDSPYYNDYGGYGHYDGYSGYSGYRGNDDYRYRNYGPGYYPRDNHSHRSDRRDYDRNRNTKSNHRADNRRDENRRAENRRQESKSSGRQYDGRTANKPNRVDRGVQRSGQGNNRAEPPITTSEIYGQRNRR